MSVFDEIKYYKLLAEKLPTKKDVISEMINEGIDLTHILVNLTKSFGIREVRMPEPEVERVRPPRRIGSTDSIRKKHH